MKKIVALGAIAALAGGMIFADEPAIDMKVAEFNGNATVKWGMDLDAGQHGFENSTGDTNLKVNLWNEGTKATEGDGIWGEIEIKGKGLAIKNKEFDGDGNVSVEKALIHLGDKAYIGIKSGDTQVGAYKFDGAIRSADNDNAKWLSDVGPADFSQGIVLGYGDDNFGIDVDFRSYYKADSEGKPYEFDTETGKAKATKTTGTSTHYTSAYAIAAEAKLKDSNEFVEGLGVDAGVAYNLSSTYNSKGDKDILVKDNPFGFAFKLDTPMVAIMEKEIAAAKEAGLDTTAEEKELEDFKKELDLGAKITDAATEDDPLKVNTLGYGVNVAYKFAIDDKYFVKPAVGFTGSIINAKAKDVSGSLNSNNLVVGALFGWGDTADANAGVYFLDGDGAKKVTPGVSVVAAIPLPTVGKMTMDGKTNTATVNSKISAVIVPSVYLGDLVENLKFGAYSEIALLKWVDDDKLLDGDDDSVTVNDRAANKDRTTAMAVAAGLAYDIKSDDLTITPKAGIRYANAAYAENGINGISPLSSNKVFDGLGIAGKDKEGNNDFFNLKAGVDVNGLIANTTLFAEYASANLLNDQDYSKDADNAVRYNVKNGTFNIGAKIHF
jgi:hypothetical protein